MDATPYQFTLGDYARRAKRRKVVVSFAGIGGTCRGLAQAGLEPGDAINHSRIALAIHRANHPRTRHHIEDVFRVKPIVGTEFFWLSPDCTHHSKAKHGKPRSGKSRALANVAPWWAKQTQVPVIGLENVEEFEDWGPLDADGYPIPERKGELFKRWVRRLEKLGYRVEWEKLRACDFGEPTVRKRLYLCARRDGQRTEWPRATHGPGLLPYRTARECIDWSIVVPSIFDRAPFLRREENVHALAGGGVLRKCPGCAAHVLERGSFAPCPECGELPRDDHDDEGLIHLRTALDERARAGGIDPGPTRGEP